MGGVVVLSRCVQHLSGARYLFYGDDFTSNGGSGCDRVFGGSDESHSSGKSGWSLSSLVAELFDLAD